MQNEWSVNEIFFSIDGEGKRAGSLAAFIRLAGCNLRCSYCDTAYAFTEGTPMHAVEIAEAAGPENDRRDLESVSCQVSCHGVVVSACWGQKKKR